ncbi:DUF7344 domain-containing protein [Natronococcus zhouii]
MGNPRQADETNDLLTICATQHCRPILSYFRNSSEDTVQLTDLIDHLEKEAHGDREQVSGQLYHSVLPRLAEVGYLEYDKRSDIVRYHGHSELEALAVAIANR